MSTWNIEISGTTEVYVTHAGQFVARFKYARPKASARHFVRALKKHFTPETYFAQRAALAPLEILKTVGYKSLNQLRAEKYASEVIPLGQFDGTSTGYRSAGGNFK